MSCSLLQVFIVLSFINFSRVYQPKPSTETTCTCNMTKQMRYSGNFLSSILVVLLLAASATKGERTYTDSKGDVFTIADDAPPPKIIINANGALSLFHLGLQSDQLVGVYDHWVIRGSTLDLDDPESGSEFGIDPTPLEIEFLKGAENLTPECTETSNGCFLNFDPDEVVDLEYDFVVAIRAGTNAYDGKQEELGHKMIWVDDKYEHNTGCYGTEGESITVVTNPENCYSISLIDVVLEIEELAAFLGIVPTQEVVDAKQAMCESASRFVSHAQDLHDQNITVAAISLRPFNGIMMNWFPTVNFPWLRTLEELGFPLVHPPNTTNVNDQWSLMLTDWFVDCDSWPNCGDKTRGAFPVDFWLADSRTYAAIESDVEGSKLQFPDPAFLADQYSYWQFNDGAISYLSIARYLNDIVEATMGLEKMPGSDAIVCTENLDVTSSTFSNIVTGGPGSGTYACKGNLQSLYTECPAESEQIVATNTGTTAMDDTVDISSSGSNSKTTRVLLIVAIASAWLDIM